MKKLSKNKITKKQTKNKKARKALVQKNSKKSVQGQLAIKSTQSVARPAVIKPHVQKPVVSKAHAPSPQKEQAQKTSAVVNTAKSSTRKAAFLCFLGVFVCMLFLESSRFKTYFEGESGEYPFLQPVGEFLHTTAERSGILFVMDSLGQLSQSLSQEFLLVANESLEAQWTAAKKFYADALGLKLEQPVGVAEKEPTTPSTEPSLPVTPQETKEHVGLAEEQGTQGTVTPPTDSPTDSSVGVSSADLLTVPAQEAEPVTPTLTLAFYDATRLSPAPSAQGIEEYLTKLPDYGRKIKVLLIGDSMMMEGLGPTLQKSLRQRSDLHVVREGRYSSGLSKPDFFNWPQNLKKLLAKHDPDLLIISLGANDTQDIMIGKRRFRIDTEEWERVYAIRVINFLELATADDRKVLWVSLPVMGRMPYANRTKIVNNITADMSAFYPGVAYENIEHLLTQNGKYTSFIKDKNNKTIRLRSKDKIHVSTAGGQILTKYLVPYADERVEVIRMEEVQGNPLIPVAGKANTVHFTSESCQKDMQYVVYLPQPQQEKLQADATQLTTLSDALPVAPSVSSIPMSIAAVQSLHAQKKNKEHVPFSVKDVVAYSLQQPQEHTKGQTMQSSLLVDEAKELFPVLYLLHGATGNAAQWNKHLGKELQNIADEQRVIIVAPSAEDFGWYVNSPLMAQNQMESMIVKELVPQVDLLFPTNGKRAVAGLSMGGHGALTLGFKYPKVFSSVASVSGVLDIRLHPDSWKIQELLGVFTQNKALWNKNSAVYLVEKSKKTSIPKQILISTGLQDLAVLKDNQDAQKILTQKKYSFEYTELEGKHDWVFWIQEIPKQLRKQAEFLHM